LKVLYSGIGFNGDSDIVLVKVLTILKEIIRDEEMFDMRNPAIILCDKDLEAALNMRALHVTEIRYRYQLYLLLTSLHFMRALHVTEIRYRTPTSLYFMRALLVTEIR
jgi:hypothetical protein